MTATGADSTVTRIVMVMPYLNYPARARERGIRICAIWDPKVAGRIFGDGAEQYLADLAGEVDQLRLTDFDDRDGFERELRAAVTEYRPRYLYHAGAEDTMLLTYEVAEELGLALNPARSVQILNDKLELRRALAAHGLSPMRFAHAERWQDVAGALDGFSLPVVVKPTGLSGSRGVRLLEDKGELADWGALLTSYGYTGPVLVEEYLDGPEFSVETMSVRGRHQVIGVTRKVLGPPPLFVEAGHIHPEPASPATEAIAALVVETLTASGYRTGPAHTEVKLTRKGPRIVESQARPGGDWIPRLVALSRGFDMAGGIFDALAGNPLSPADGTGTARIHYFDLPHGVVTSVSGLDQVRELKSVHDVRLPFSPGDVIPHTVDWQTRHGYVIVSGRSAEHTLELALHAESLLHIEVDTRSAAAAGPRSATDTGAGPPPPNGTAA